MSAYKILSLVHEAASNLSFVTNRTHGGVSLIVAVVDTSAVVYMEWAREERPR